MITAFLRDIRYSARSLARSPGVSAAVLFSIALGLGVNITILGFARGISARRVSTPSLKNLTSIFRSDPHPGTGAASYDDFLLLRNQPDLWRWLGAVRIAQSIISTSGRSEVLTVADGSPEIPTLFQNSTPQELYVGQPIDRWRPLNPATLLNRSVRNLWLLAELRPNIPPERLAEITALGFSITPYNGLTPQLEESLSRIRTILYLASAAVFLVSSINVACLLLGRAAFRLKSSSIRVALGISPAQLLRATLADSIVIAGCGAALSMLLASWTTEIIPSLLFEKDARFLLLIPSIGHSAMLALGGFLVVAICGLLPLLESGRHAPASVLRRESAGPSRTSQAIRSTLVITEMACCCLLVIGTANLYAAFRAIIRSNSLHYNGQPVLASVQARPDNSVDLHFFRNIEQSAKSLPGISGGHWTARLPGAQPAFQSFRLEPLGLPQREVTLNGDTLSPDSLSRFHWPPQAGHTFGLNDRACPVVVVNSPAAAALFKEETTGRSIIDAAGRPFDVIGVLQPRKPGASPTLYFPPHHSPSPKARYLTPNPSTLQRVDLNTNVVSPEYFTAMGYSLLSGQVFPADPPACRLALINEQAAQLYLTKNAIGSAVIDDLGRRTHIIGVVRSVRLGAFERAAEPTIFFPMLQDCLPYMTLLLDANTANPAMLNKIKDTLQAVPGRGPAPVVVKTLESYLRQTALAPLFIVTALVAVCAATAFLLCLLGLYGALNDAARARRRDIALRIALGARRRHVIRHVLRQGARLAGLGILAGTLSALLLSRLLPSITAASTIPELWVWFAGPLVLGAIVILASIIPARRALLVDPIRLLRNE